METEKSNNFLKKKKTLLSHVETKNNFCKTCSSTTVIYSPYIPPLRRKSISDADVNKLYMLSMFLYRRHLKVISLHPISLYLRE